MNFTESDGRHSSLSVTGEHIRTSASNTPPKKTYKYRRIASSSTVDETLFVSHRDQLLSSQESDQRSFHECFKDHQPRPKSAVNSKPPIKSALGINSVERPQSRSRYHLTHPKSYVDETLFGPQLESPTFDPPWADKEAKKKGKPLFWSPPVAGSLSFSPMSVDTRQESAVRRPQSGASVKRPSTSSKAPWK